MIYNREESEVAVLGEVQKYKVGIDERNINHIVTILSSNLYSHPMTSFLRETVSNAVDSHIEAGSDEPIIIQHTATDISIRDYGTGISPERFKEIYINIGSSTKRESNEYIGMWGLGRFSALAVADIVNITSFYEGNAYYYVMNKDVDQLHIDLLDVLPTKEPNGVEVKVPIEHWDCSTLRCLAFIDNLYVESDDYKCKYEIEYFNKRKILTFKTFKAVSWYLTWGRDDTEVLIGKIPYKVDYDTLWDYSDGWHKSWRDCFKSICPQIEIGQVDITPNREGLLYSERTKKVLKEAYDACIQEVMELWKQACTKEYESIKEYADYLIQYCHDYLDLGGIKVRVSNKLSYDACYKKYKEWSNIPVEDRKEIVRSIYNRGIEVLGKLDDKTLRQGERMKSWFTVRKLFQEWLDSPTRKVIAIPSAAGMSSQYFKDFLNEKYPDTTNLLLRQLPITLRYIRRVIRESLGITTLSDYAHLTFTVQLIHEMLLYVKQHIEVTSIIGSKEYEQYKKDHCVKKDRTYISTEKICFTITPCSGNGSYKQTATLREIIPLLKKKYFNDVHLVYANLDNPFVSAFQGLHYQNLVIISAAKNKMSLIRKGLPSWVRPIEELYSPDNRVLQKKAALQYILSQPEIDSGFYGNKCFPQPIREMIKQLRNKYTDYHISETEYMRDEAIAILNIVPPEKYDKEIMALWNQTKKWLELSHKLIHLSYSAYNDRFKYYILLKNKKFRINWEFYCEIKENVKKLLERI